MNQRHLSDDRLIEISLAGSVPAGDHAHLAACPECVQRRATLTELLDEIDHAATLEVDTLFPADRLARQQAHILQRIDQDGRPGRLIAFPAAQPPTPLLLRSRPRARWAAGVAAAAFVVGLLAGHLVHDFPGAARRGTPAPRMVANETDATPLRAVSTTLSDDEFLGQIELAVGSAGPSALRPLDALTPRAWEDR
jgi:hypothetical protein